MLVVRRGGGRFVFLVSVIMQDCEVYQVCDLRCLSHKGISHHNNKKKKKSEYSPLNVLCNYLNVGIRAFSTFYYGKVPYYHLNEHL